MRTMFKYIYTTLVVAVQVLFLASCRSDINDSRENMSADITVQLLSKSSDETGDGTLQNLSIQEVKTVRLILSQEGKVVSNRLLTGEQLQAQSSTGTVIKIVGLKKANTDFYVIANEASTGKDFSEYTLGSPLTSESFNNIVLLSGDDSFPKVDEVPNGIPMVGHQFVEADNLVTNVIVKLTRLVSKIELNITNKRPEALTVQNVNFQTFFPAQTKLGSFDHGSYSDKDFVLSTPRVIQPKGSSTILFYLYESKAGTGNYKVGIQCAGGITYDPVAITDNTTGGNIESLLRNVHLTVNAEAKSASMNISGSITPWDEVSSDVNFIDELSYTSSGWNPESIIDLLEKNTVLLNPFKSAELSFVILSPNTATWRAQLLGDTESLKAIEFDGPNAGEVSYDESGSAYSQLIKVRINENYKTSDRKYTAELRVYVKIAGKEYEIDLTPASNQYNVNNQSGTIQRFTLQTP